GNLLHLEWLLLFFARAGDIEAGELRRSRFDITQTPSQLDGVLLELWKQLTVNEQRMLSASALLGSEFPRAAFDALPREIRYRFPDGRPGWLRLRERDGSFIELARWQLARREIHLHRPEARRAYLTEALDACLRVSES